MAKAMFVLALLAVCLGLMSARTVHKRQVPPTPGPINFQTEWYLVQRLVLQTQYDLFKCQARLLFQDPNPVLVFDAATAPATTAAPLDPVGTTASIPTGGQAKRQVPGQQQNFPLQQWQVNIINQQLGVYDYFLAQLQQCTTQLNFQGNQGGTGGTGGGIVG